MIKQGTIKYWNSIKHYGFIKPDDGDEPIFVHGNAFREQKYIPQNNQRVSFCISKDHVDRICAKDVTVLSKANNLLIGRRPWLSQISLSVKIVLIFFSILIIDCFVFGTPKVILLVYLVFSLLTFLVYAKDKSAAKNNRWRTPEITLHVFSLFGGWPGAMLAQEKLRHKSIKKAFRIIYWATVLLNILLLISLHLSTGRVFLEWVDHLFLVRIIEDLFIMV